MRCALSLGMTPAELKDRTINFAIRVYRFIRPMLAEPDSRHVAMQLFRSATSVAANYRAVCLARSRKEFSAKAGLLREESDESLFWLEFIAKAGMASPAQPELRELTVESDELARIFRATYRTSQTNLGKKGTKHP